MANRASAIILSKRHILLIRRVRERGRERIREQREFYVFPGGRIKENESPAQACAREVEEETGLLTAWLEPAFDHLAEGEVAHFFFVAVHPGILALGGPETQKQSGQNRYLLEWVPLIQIGSLSLQPPAVRDALARLAAENGPLREAQDLSAHREKLQDLLGG